MQRRKARIVTKEYSQKYGVDYHQIFAPVARLETTDGYCCATWI